MNIIEAYIKFKGQLLIFISGLSGCGKSTIGKKIAKDFKLKLIDQFDYYKKGHDTKFTLPDNTTIINWYMDEAVDWDNFNKDIDEFKKNGLVVIGFSLPEDKIIAEHDFHIHLNISKQVCMEKRKAFLEKYKDKYEEEYKLIGTPVEKLKMNQIIYPYYIESTKKSKINKFANMNTQTDDEAYNDIFNVLVKFISDYLYQPKTNADPTKTPKVTDSVSQVTDSVSKVTNITTDNTDSISASLELMDEPKYVYDQSDDLDMVTYLSKQNNYLKREGPIKILELK